MLSLTVAACGGGDSKTPDAAIKDVGFNKPTKGVKANMQTSGTWSEIGPADLSCLGTPSDDQATTVAVTLHVNVADFQSGNAVPGAMVTAFKDVMTDMPFDTQTADTNAHATITIPVGTKRFGFKMTTSDMSTMPTFLLNQTVAPSVAVQPADTACSTPPCFSKIQSVSASTAATLPALIGETRNTGTGVIAGAFRDCMKHEISNFVATVSSTKGTATPIAGAEAYYFSDAVDLPVHHQQQEAASKDALFMVIQLPATQSAYVQMWGYKTDADAMAGGEMTLLAELPVPVLADTVITGSYEPLRQ
ncbi:MAG: hypothetical protein JO257_06800 [Deltaproteobacteria bacterium]|nr:hypothetical protein [Deltaproteobacteria bacterium]